MFYVFGQPCLAVTCQKYVWATNKCSQKFITYLSGQLVIWLF